MLVGSGTGIRPGALRPDPQRAECVGVDQRPAAGTDGSFEIHGLSASAMMGADHWSSLASKLNGLLE